MIVQYHAATSGSRRLIPRFYSELVSQVFSVRSTKLSFKQWFIGMVISTVFRCVLAVNVILNALDVAANVLIQLGCKREKSKRIRTVFETAHFFTRVYVEGTLNQSREHFREWIHWFRVERRLIHVKNMPHQKYKGYCRCMFTSPIKNRIRFHVVAVQWTSKKCTKKCDTRRAKLLFCSHIFFFTLSSSLPPSLLERSNITSSRKGRVKEFIFQLTASRLEQRATNTVVHALAGEAGVLLSCFY